MAKKIFSVWFGLILSSLILGGGSLFGQEVPVETSRSQTQVMSIGILEFRDESDANVVQFGLLATQQIRQKILVGSQDLLPRILGADAGATARPGMTVQELTDLGRQFGVKLIVRGGILPVTVEAANGETKATVRLYADIVAIESGTINTVRVEGSDTQAGTFPDLAGSDAASPDFAKSPVGQALGRALDRLAQVIHEQALSLTAAAPTPEPVPAEQAQQAETPVGQEVVPEAPVDAAAQAAEQDLELQQLIADAQATLNAGVAADPQLLNQVSQGLANLQSNLAVKADQLQKGENTEQIEQAIAQNKTELRAAIDAVMQSRAVTESAGSPAAGGSPQAGNILNQANNYAAEAISLIQKIKDVRALLWGADQEAQVVTQDQAAPVTDQPTDQPTEQPTEQPIEEVTGVVIDDGQPVEGAEVTDSESGATTTTGSDGHYTLQIQPGILSKIVVKKKGVTLATNRIQVVKGRANVSDFVLAKSGTTGVAGAISSTSLGRAGKGAGGMIKGTITTPEGKPAPQVLVQLPQVGTVRSNSLGQFTFLNVPAGAHKLSVQQPGLEPQILQVRVTAKTTSNATLRLATARVVRPVPTVPLIVAGSGSAVYGRVKDKQNNAVIGAQVTAIRGGSTASVLTDRQGKYELKDLSPGEYKIRLSKPGFQSAQGEVNLRSNKREKRDFEIMMISPVFGQMRKIEQSKLGGLRGKVKGSDNRTLAGATVEAAPVGQQLQSVRTRTSSEGEFKLSLREGRYQVHVTQANYRSETRSVNVQAGKLLQQDFALSRALGVAPALTRTTADTRTLGKAPGNEPAKTSTVGGLQTTRVEPGRIAGRTTDSKTGKPIRGAQVFLHGQSIGQTDQNGNFTIGNLSPGEYRVGVKEEGYVSQEKLIEVRAGGSSRADFALFPPAAVASRSAARTIEPLSVPSSNPGQIEGRVIDSKTGRPVSGATVAVSGLGSTATDASGSFRFGNLKPNTYQISVTRSGYQGQQKTVRVDSGRTVNADFSIAPTLVAPRVVVPRK